jgi:hypothetical protein
MSGAQQFCAYCGRPAGAGHEPYCESVRRGREEEAESAARDRRLAVAVAIAAVGFFLMVSIAKGQDVPLRVDGAKIVQVDRQVIVKVDVTVVDRLPFSVQAPAGAGLYFWSYPAGIVATDKGDRLEVTAAAKGETTVGVKMITADLDKDGKFRGFLTKFGSVTFTVGDVPNPKPPEPKPDPPKPDPVVDQFTKELQAAFDREPAADRVAKLAALVASCRATASAAADALTDHALRNLYAKEVAAKVAPALPAVRGVIVRRLDKTLAMGGTPVSLTTALRAAIAAEFNAVAEALGRVK